MPGRTLVPSIQSSSSMQVTGFRDLSHHLLLVSAIFLDALTGSWLEQETQVEHMNANMGCVCPKQYPNMAYHNTHPKTCVSLKQVIVEV